MVNKEIELTYPIIIIEDGQETVIKTIKFERPKIKHIKLLPRSVFAQKKGKKIDIGVDELLPLIGALTGLTKEQIDEIDYVDLIKISGELENFF